MGGVGRVIRGAATTPIQFTFTVASLQRLQQERKMKYRPGTIFLFLLCVVIILKEIEVETERERERHKKREKDKEGGDGLESVQSVGGQNENTTCLLTKNIVPHRYRKLGTPSYIQLQSYSVLQNYYNTPPPPLSETKGTRGKNVEEKIDIEVWTRQLRLLYASQTLHD